MVNFVKEFTSARANPTEAAQGYPIVCDLTNLRNQMPLPVRVLLSMFGKVEDLRLRCMG